MNKALTKLFTAAIRSQVERHRWRGILRYGLIKSLKVKMLGNYPHPPANYLAICAIAKNEGQYFKEWLDWHISQGVDKFYIYDNDSSDNTREVLSLYIRQGIVEYTSFPGRQCQMPAYDDCITRHRLDSRWIAFLDIDEFVIPVKDDSFRQFMRRMEDYPAVEINWLVYGSGGATKQEPGDVMQRFRYHSLPENPVNRHVKTIIDPRRVVAMTSPHDAACVTGLPADSHGDTISASYKHREPQHDVIRINHYAVKSREEYLRRKSGDNLLKNPPDWEKLFVTNDLNDIEDKRVY